METLIVFGKGPLFRFCFALMILGLARVVFLCIAELIEAYKRYKKKKILWGEVFKYTINWLFPVKRLLNKRPIYSILSVIFHLGFIFVPLFYIAHINAVKSSIGMAWFAMPNGLADWLTLLSIAAGLLLFLMRVFYRPSRILSRFQDFFWILVIILPLLTGWLCVHAKLSANLYIYTLFIHIYSANLVMVLIPFTKIAHCVLAPLSHLVTDIGWKFPEGAGKQVAETLGITEKP